MRHDDQVRHIVPRCPYCGEPIDASLDVSDGEDQALIEDCTNCCKPLLITAHYDQKAREFVTDASRDI
jgi:hypothetical protein